MQEINTIGLILCGIALVLTVVLNIKKKYPLGLLAMIFAMLIGVGVMGMKLNDIVAAFPSSTILSLLLAVPFFGTLAQTGMLTVLGKRLLKLVRGDVRKLPLVAVPAIALVGVVTGTQIPFIFGPILIGIAQAGGMDLMVVVVMLAFASQIGGFNPWTLITGQMISGYAQSSGLPNPEGMAIAVWLNGAITFLSVVALGYFVFKGHKAKNVSIDVAEDLEMTPQQKKAFKIFIVAVVLLIVPATLLKFFPKVLFLVKLNALCTNNIIFSIGLLVCVALKFTDFEAAMKKVPMSLVFMIVGILMLLKVADNAGFSTLISKAISEHVPVFLIPAAFTMAACIMSYFATAFAVMPVLWSVALPVSAATGVNATVLLTCIVIGACGSGSGSPMSAGGAATLSVFPAEEQASLSKRMLVFNLVVCVWFTLLALAGVYNIGPAVLGV